MFSSFGLITTGLAVLVIVATFLSRVPVAHGALRYLDFPRVQLLFIAVLVAVALVFAGLPEGWRLPLYIALALAAADHALHVLRFTPLWRVQSIANGQDGNSTAQIRILCSNVKMSNGNHKALGELIRRMEPDIFIGMEVNGAWVDGLSPVMEDFPHRVTHPQENSYGIALWSRLPLSEVKVRNLLVRDVPSIRASVTLRDQRRVALFVLHPEPPVPHHDTEARDAEIGLVGIETTESDLPAIVTGDLNDVAWSRTTRRFQRLSGLLDPRVGRGLYSSFDARYFFLRWPLDHLFHDPHFRLVDLRRLEHIGSDHFPMYFVLELNGRKAQGEGIGDATEADHQEVRTLAAREAERDRRPIGEDWE